MYFVGRLHSIAVAGKCEDSRRLVASFERWFDLTSAECWPLVLEDRIVVSTLRKIGMCLHIPVQDIEDAVKCVSDLAVERQMTLA